MARGALSGVVSEWVCHKRKGRKGAEDAKVFWFVAWMERSVIREFPAIFIGPGFHFVASDRVLIALIIHFSLFIIHCKLRRFNKQNSLLHCQTGGLIQEENYASLRSRISGAPGPE